METTTGLKAETVQHGMGELIAALSKAQAKFESPKNLKTGQQGNRRFKYAPLEEIIRATREALAANGLAITTYIEPREPALFVTSELRLAGCDACITSRYPLTAGLQTQDRGKEITYGRRYNRCALLDVVGEDSDADDGMDGSAPDEAEAEAKRKEAEKRLDALKGKGTVRSAYDGKVLAPGEPTLPAERTVGTADHRPQTADRKPGKTAGPEAPALPDGKRAAETAATTPGNGIAKPLADLMRRDGISPEALKAYYVGKGHLPDTVDPTALPPDYVAGLIKSENWKKAVTAIKGGK